MARKRTPKNEVPSPTPAPPAPAFRPLTDEEIKAQAEAAEIDKSMGHVPEAHTFLRETVKDASISIAIRLDAAEAYLKSTGDLDEELQEIVFAMMGPGPSEVKQRVRAAKLLLGVA